MVWLASASNGAPRAKAAIAEARGALLARAQRIQDPGSRKTFLEGISEHARTLELASAWSP